MRFLVLLLDERGGIEVLNVDRVDVGMVVFGHGVDVGSDIGSGSGSRGVVGGGCTAQAAKTEVIGFVPRFDFRGKVGAAFFGDFVDGAGIVVGAMGAIDWSHGLGWGRLGVAEEGYGGPSAWLGEDAGGGAGDEVVLVVVHDCFVLFFGED